jgi:hypothetical protein
LEEESDQSGFIGVQTKRICLGNPLRNIAREDCDKE